MKTLILKELRENLKLAVIGLLLSIVVVVGTQMYYLSLIKDVATGFSAAQNYYYRLQPLTSGNFVVFSGFLCGLVGLALGWFQIHSERHRDLWAFLVHRPVTRTTIFLSKAIAGFILYTLAVGVPLVYFVLWVRTPGHVAAPFEWEMAWPVLGGFLSGVAWYFAGMLTSIRQARWYGSRALGLGAALVVTAAAYGGLNFWMAIVMTLILALAVWGAFHNRGEFQGQPAVGKAALALSLTPGAGAVFVGAVALALEIIIGLNGASTIWPHYSMRQDGAIYKVTGSNGVPEILSLEGKPLIDPDTGKPMELEKFNRTGTLGGATASYWREGYGVGPQSEPFHLFSGNRHTLWFRTYRTGRINGFDVRTRQFIGSIGPDGFSTDENGDGSAFLRNDQWAYMCTNVRPLPLASTNAVYQVDLENHSVKTLWTVANGDTIKACGGTPQGENTVVLTRRDIFLFHFMALPNLPENDGKPVLTIPFPYFSQDYSTVTVYGFPKATQPSYCVWIAPTYWSSNGGRSRLPTQVLWLAKSGEITKREDLPDLAPQGDSDAAESIINTILPPLVQLTTPWLSNEPNKHPVDWHFVGLSFGVSFLCALVGLWLGWRNHFSANKQLIWMLFNLLFGVSGLLAFLSAQDWPVRKPCPQCQKLRTVDRETCEHCGSEFAPPEKNGTEIFDPLEVR